jgi:nicotinamidase-related amidase
VNEKVLLVVDAQNDFVTGRFGSPEAKDVVPNIVEKVKQYEPEEII